MSDPPNDLLPMLARSGDLPTSEGWAYEIKWDGVRALARCVRGEVGLRSRNGRDITRSYPELIPLAQAIARPALLDGELVALDERGVPSFARLQQRMHVESPSAARTRAVSTPVVYMIFDLLHLDGRSLLDLPYSSRRSELEALALRASAWQTPAIHLGDPQELLAHTLELGLEGLVAKRLHCTYEPGRRSGAWVKHKNVRSQELVVGGWLPGEGRRSETIGALLVGHREAGGALRYAGRVGTGFSDATLADLQRRLSALARSVSPFAPQPPGAVAPPSQARYVEPRLVAQVAFSEWTPDGMLRHPSFLGLRDDVDPLAVVREDEAAPGHAQGVPSPSQVRLSNRDKVMFGATRFTKGDLIDYYEEIAGVMVPHLRGRPLTLKRYPDGVDGEFFYEKRCPGHRPAWVQTVRVGSGRAGVIEHCTAADAATLVWTANLAAIELHVPMWSVAAPERPTAVVFDLDPGTGAGLAECVEVALILERMFAALGLSSVVKTSGAKGLQVYLPLDGSADHAQAKSFARHVATLLAGSAPDLVLASMNRDARAGRVFVDWSQNDRHKTTVAVYSMRATERPSVSAPLAWDEVRAAAAGGDVGALRLGPAEVLERVRRDGDLFAAALDRTQRLPAI